MYECHLFYKRIRAIIDAIGPNEESGAALPTLIQQHKDTFSTLESNLGNLNNLANAVIDMNIAPREFVVQSQFDEGLAEIREELDALSEEVDQVSAISVRVQ